MPVALICVSIWAPELSFAVGLIGEPLTLVLCLIRPALHTVSAFFPFFVDVARIECVLHHFDIFDELQLVLIDHLPQFEDLLLRTTVESLKILVTRLVQLLLHLQTRLEVLCLFALLILGRTHLINGFPDLLNGDALPFDLPLEEYLARLL